MNSSIHRIFSLLLVMVLFFASIQSVFASQIKNRNDHALHHSLTVTHVGKLALVSRDMQFDNEHRHFISETGTENGRMAMGSMMLCTDSTCTQCVHCVSFISIPYVVTDKSKPILNSVISTFIPSLEIPTKDRPPRNI